MKIENNRVEVITNSTGSEKIKMGIDPSSFPMILNILIKQYSDPNKAGLQEYLSNARDSHIESGQTRPVELTLPNALNPQLVIEDFGMGLDRAGLEEFGQFGASTKRNTNDLVGGFGLGSKSGLAMAAQFTATAVKDGFRNTIVVFRDEDSSPTMRFVNEKPIPVAASTPNGVRVSIPSSEQQKFQKIISEENFFLGWEPYSILVDDEVPLGMKSVFDPDQYTPIFEGLDGDPLGWDRIGETLRSTLYSPSIAAVIGSVTYKLDLRQFSNASQKIMNEFRNSGTVLNIENGHVEIHPSRESLIYDKRTIEYIEMRFDLLYRAAHKMYQMGIDSATTIEDALEEYFRVKNLLMGTQYSYHSAPFTFNLKITDSSKQSLIRGRLGRQVTLVPSYDIASGYKLSSNEVNLESICVQGSNGRLRGGILVSCPRTELADETSDAHRYLDKLRDTFTVRGVLGLGRTDGPTVSYVDAEAYEAIAFSPFTSAQFSEIMTSEEFAVYVDKGTEILRERRTAQRQASAGLFKNAAPRVVHRGNPLVRTHNLDQEVCKQVRLDTLDPTVEYLLLPQGTVSGDYNSQMSKDFGFTKRERCEDFLTIKNLVRFYLKHNPATQLIALPGRAKVDPLVEALPKMKINAIETVTKFFTTTIRGITADDVQKFQDYRVLLDARGWSNILRVSGRVGEIKNEETRKWVQSADAYDSTYLSVLESFNAVQRSTRSSRVSSDNGITSIDISIQSIEVLTQKFKGMVNSRSGVYPLIDSTTTESLRAVPQYLDSLSMSKEGITAIIEYVNMVDISNAN